MSHAVVMLFLVLKIFLTMKVLTIFSDKKCFLLPPPGQESLWKGSQRQNEVGFSPGRRVQVARYFGALFAVLPMFKKFY